MATSGGPRLKGLDRGNALLSAVSVNDALCYAGDPTTNICYDSSRSGYATLSQNYDWNNSGTSSRTNNPAGIPKPVGYGSTTIAVVEKKCLTTGSQHFGMGFNVSVSGGTTYTCSMWYRQNRVGVGGPYVRQYNNNNSLGGMEWIGYDGTQAITGTSNWPANEWILLKKTVTTTAGETGLYISNYIGNTVGDTALAFGPQFEAKSYFTPIVLNSARTAAALTRTEAQALTDLSRQGNSNILNGAVIGRNHFKNGSTVDLCSSSEPIVPCLDLDGTDDYLDTGEYLGMPVTISVWWRRDKSDTSGSNRVINANIWNNSTSNYYNSFYMHISDPYYGSGGSIESWAYSFVNGTRTDFSAGGYPSSINEKWRHYAIVFDNEGESTISNGKVYLDGAYLGLDTGFWKDWGSANKKSTILIGGARAYATEDGTSPTMFFTGQIANAQVFKAALTAEQIKQNYNTFKSHYKL